MSESLTKILNLDPRKLEVVIGNDGEPLNPRQRIDTQSLHGDEVKVPLKVYVGGDGKYYVLSGHRRQRWAIQRGFKTVPCIVVESPYLLPDILLTMIEENNYTPFSPLEKAEAVRKLAEMGQHWTAIACAMGEDQKTVMLLSDLNDAPEAIKTAVDEGRLSLSAWDKMRKESASRQEAILEKAIAQSRNGKATVQAVRKARAGVAAETNGAPMIGDESVVVQWNKVKGEVERLLAVPTPKGDQVRIEFVKAGIKTLLEGEN